MQYFFKIYQSLENLKRDFLQNKTSIKIKEKI